jgi:hypothetical protein
MQEHKCTINKYVVHEQAQLELHPEANHQPIKLDQDWRHKVPLPDLLNQPSRCVLNPLQGVA